MFGSAAPTNNNFLAQSTPINQNRTASGFLFNSTATQPSALTSTPFGSTTLFGKNKRSKEKSVSWLFQEEQLRRRVHRCLQQLELDQLRNLYQLEAPIKSLKITFQQMFQQNLLIYVQCQFMKRSRRRLEIEYQMSFHKKKFFFPSSGASIRRLYR